MYKVYVTSFDKEHLPTLMLNTLKDHRKWGRFKDLIHLKDTVTQADDGCWEMISYWDTPEEVAKL